MFHCGSLVRAFFLFVFITKHKSLCLLRLSSSIENETGNNHHIAISYKLASFPGILLGKAGREFYDIVERANAYFDSLRTEIGDEAMNVEGGPYSSYKKYVDFWGLIHSKQLV
jgi:hypothetical protein